MVSRVLLRALPALAALVLFAVVPALVAQDQQERQQQQERPGQAAQQQHQWIGKIMKVEADQRQLVLGDARMITRPGLGTDRPGAGQTERPGAGQREGQEKGRTINFLVPDTAQVTLDGQRTELEKLRPGLWARIHVQAPGKETAGAGQQQKEREKVGAGAQGQRMTATRVEAFTKAPPGFDTGRQDKDRP